MFLRCFAIIIMMLGGALLAPGMASAIRGPDEPVRCTPPGMRILRSACNDVMAQCRGEPQCYPSLPCRVAMKKCLATNQRFINRKCLGEWKVPNLNEKPWPGPPTTCEPPPTKKAVQNKNDITKMTPAELAAKAAADAAAAASKASAAATASANAAAEAAKAAASAAPPATAQPAAPAVGAPAAPTDPAAAAPPPPVPTPTPTP